MKMGRRDQQRVRKRKKIIEGKKTEWGRKRKEEIGKWIVKNGEMERMREREMMLEGKENGREGIVKGENGKSKSGEKKKEKAKEKYKIEKWKK